jgi:putative transcriptional regulator
LRDRAVPYTQFHYCVNSNIAAASSRTDEALARMKPVPRARTLRRALGLMQEQFAGRYHIPIGTLRDWEQGRSEPDQPARAYLIVIAHDPEGVRRALEAKRG